MGDSVTASDVCHAIKAKYSGPDWRVWFEVNQGTGMQTGRRADAVVMNVWPSKKYQVHCFEVKVSRADFMHEMKDPAKAEAVGQFCDFFWLAVPVGLVQVEEVPVTWGLIELTKGGLRVKKQAPLREAVEFSRSFAASLLRAGEDRGERHIEKLVQERTKGVERRAQENAERRFEKALAEQKSRNDALERWRQAFEAEFGIRPATYRPPEEMAARISFATQLDQKRFADLASQARALAETIDAMEKPDRGEAPGGE